MIVSCCTKHLYYIFFSLFSDDYNSFSDFQLIFRQPIRYLNIFISFSDFSINIQTISFQFQNDRSSRHLQPGKVMQWGKYKTYSDKDRWRQWLADSLHLQNKKEIRRLYHKLREEKRRPYTYGLGLSVADRRGKEKLTRRN